MERERFITNERKYSNEEITVYWKPGACIHASYCYRDLLEVFDPARRPWVNMKGASAERIIEVVNMCPTEALTWKWNDDKKNETVGKEHTNHVKYRRPGLINDKDKPAEKEIPVVVQIISDGPIVIEGSITLKYNDTVKDISDTPISLCRCGKSGNKPFCDGSHSE